MLAHWRSEHPQRDDVIFAGLQNAVPAHLLDRALFDFGELREDPVDSDHPFENILMASGRR
jgi:tRNA 2-thiocytidine biosynthesis protein TtcA